MKLWRYCNGNAMCAVGKSRCVQGGLGLIYGLLISRLPERDGCASILPVPHIILINHSWFRPASRNRVASCDTCVGMTRIAWRVTLYILSALSDDTLYASGHSVIIDLVRGLGPVRHSTSHHTTICMNYISICQEHLCEKHNRVFSASNFIRIRKWRYFYLVWSTDWPNI